MTDCAFNRSAWQPTELYSPARARSRLPVSCPSLSRWVSDGSPSRRCFRRCWVISCCRLTRGLACSRELRRVLRWRLAGGSHSPECAHARGCLSCGDRLSHGSDDFPRGTVMGRPQVFRGCLLCMGFRCHKCVVPRTPGAAATGRPQRPRLLRCRRRHRSCRALLSGCECGGRKSQQLWIHLGLLAAACTIPVVVVLRRSPIVTLAAQAAVVSAGSCRAAPEG